MLDKVGHMGSLDIAVIMSTYAERPEWLRASIESILEQTYPHFRFYIVLDNPGNDELNSIVREYAEKDSRIQVIANEHNRGLTDSLNRAIQASSEPYIARMDADDIAYPERLQKELEFLSAYDLDFVSCGADIIAGDEIVPGRKLPTLFSQAIAEIEGITNVFFHPSWLLRRDVYDALGGYRSIASCEDYDFVLRALQQGFRLGRMEEMLMEYRFAESGISYSSWMTQEVNARFLREQYNAGASLESIPAEEINRLGADASESERCQYGFAKESYDGLFTAAGSRRYGKAAMTALNGMMRSKAFRRKMMDAVRERVMIPQICRRYEGEETVE